MIRITTLMDDELSRNLSLRAEHGLSYLIETPDRKILFDTGGSSATLENARILGRDLNHLDAIVLSHGHYDHCYGFRSISPGRKNYVGKNFFGTRLEQFGIKFVDISSGLDETIYDFETVEDHTEILPGIHAIGNFDRITKFETIPSKFVRLIDGKIVQDMFEDEICLVIENRNALHVLVGCSHLGIVNMISRVKKFFDKPIETLLGGIHLNSADKDRIIETMMNLKMLGVKNLCLSHCSGEIENSTHFGTGDCLFL